VSISGNVFSGLTEKAITLVGESTGVVFANNVLRDVDSDHTRITSGTVSNNEESQSSGGATK
jgi:hypothetical protein